MYSQVSSTTVNQQNPRALKLRNSEPGVLDNMGEMY